MRTTTPDHVVVLANEPAEQLAIKVSRQMGLPYTPITRQHFCDGEKFHALPNDLAGKDIILIACTHNDNSQQELIDLIDGCRFWGADSVNVVIPYLGYSTMERCKPDSGEIPKGITRTRQIFRAHPTFVAFIDLHSEAVLHAHDINVRTKHIHTDQLVVDKIRSLPPNDYVLVSPDYGRSKWVAQLATILNLPHTAADKDRFAMDKTMVGQVAGVVKGKVAIICDDMIRTGGSILQTAQRCIEAGATECIVLATHLVLCGEARQRFTDSGIQRIIGSDTYPGVEDDELLDVYSVAPLIAEVMINHLDIR